MSRLALQRDPNRVGGEVGAECPMRDTVWNIYIEPAFYLLALWLTTPVQWSLHLGLILSLNSCTAVEGLDHQFTSADSAYKILD